MMTETASRFFVPGSLEREKFVLFFPPLLNSASHVFKGRLWKLTLLLPDLLKTFA